MRAVLQRVSRAQVRVAGEVIGAIERGMVALVGVERGDGPQDVRFLADKIPRLRIFADPEDKMNLDLHAVGGEILAISQFTLLADCRKGLRPSFVTAERPEMARHLFDSLVEALRGSGCRVATGIFRALMEVELVNEGPVTIWLDSRRG